MARKKASTENKTDTYRHPESESPMRPDVGTQAQFKKQKFPRTYRYDSSLSPALNWDGQNPTREQGEAAIREVLEAKTLEDAKAAASKLKALGKPFLDWAGKAERFSFDVPTLPLFVHERLSTQAILETIKSHKTDKQLNFDDLFGDPRHSIADQVLKAYEHKDKWVNRMVLGDSLVVMNSLLHYEGLGGQVQMIYMDPPYGVKFGSNFQPFVRQRDIGSVDHNDDESLTREPEMVQAYRDTWEFGVHSYLTYLRDRLLLCRDLLAPTGSIFVQISDVNLHHVREVMDEVFGEENFVSQISFQTTSGFETKTIATLGDFLLWYAKDKKQVKVHKLFEKRELVPGEGNATWVLLANGDYRGVTAAEKRGESPLPERAKLYNPDNIQSQGASSEPQPFEFEGKVYEPGGNSHWKANYPEGMNRLAKAGRIHVAKNSIRFRRFSDDFPYKERGNIWTDTISGNFTDEKIYVVQTNAKVVQRCMLLTTNPGDLVLDPTCGSGTTAYCAEGWGRRWITIDTSRVPLALARQRILTATFPWFKLIDDSRGPAAGFNYERRQNAKGEEVGGIIPHITLESIANNAPPDEEVLFDKPEDINNVVRVAGPFTLEATIPTPIDWEGDPSTSKKSETAEGDFTFVERMLEVLRKSPILRLDGKRTVTLKNLRLPAKALSLSAEGMVVNGKDKTVALVFGPENGAVSEKLVFEAAREATAKNYATLYVIGFAIQANARALIEKCESIVGIPAIYIQATPDLMMGDLLKSMRSSQIFSVCGLPEIKVSAKEECSKETRYQVELLGFDVFDPATMEVVHRAGDDVPAWFLDTNYNDLCFHVSQAFFPRTSAWDNLKRALKAEYSEKVWDHLAGRVSAPFGGGEHQQIAVKVIDDRGNELLVVKSLKGIK
ncbi:MAG: site-specific DNA-methyltransferase [Elusimicrobia bacterium]|nr:site-specific DNA-methyltransferase [Elusimicrobiota bacterium]